MLALSLACKRRYIIFSIIFVLIVISLFITGVLSFGYDSFIGEKFVGIVQSRAEAEARLEAVNSQLESPVSESLRLYPKIVVRGTLTPGSETEDNIKLASGQMQRGIALVLDGNVLFALARQDDMRRLIDEYTLPYKTENTSNAALEGNIVYESGIYLNSFFIPYDKALSLLRERPFNVLTNEKVTETETVQRPVTQVEDSTLYEGDVKVAEEGSDGKKNITKIILKRNGEIISEENVSEEILVQPVSRIEEIGTLAITGIGSGIFSRPVSGRITSDFGTRWGKMHKGTDFAGAVGDSVRAADSGTVEFTGSEQSFGNFIIIDHKNGYETYYAHLSQIYVSEGEKIKSGQIIGAIGNTGNSTGPHLHFEIRENKEAKNPMDFLPK